MENDTEEPILFIGTTDGNIFEPRGENAFGWDPIFEPKSYLNKTFGEMTLEEKNIISHRYRAFEKMMKHFKLNKKW